MEIKKVINKKTGKPMYYKDGKLISAKEIPMEEKTKGCLFCDTPTEFQRNVAFKDTRIDVKLCANCYFIKTLGEIVERLNKKED